MPSDPSDPSDTADTADTAEATEAANANDACVLGIDLGTSGVRVVAMDARKHVRAQAQRRFSDLVAVDTGQYRQPELWWQSVVDACLELFDSFAADRIVAISVDGTSGTVLAIDAQGQCLAEPMMYNDKVNDKAVLQRIAAHMPANSAAGGTSSGLAKALLFSSLKPYALIHQADWIVGQLCGVYTYSDANNALKSGYDPVAKCWPGWLRDTGINMNCLPDVRVPGTPLQCISAQTAKRFGLQQSVQLVAGTTDGCASFLATGASEVGDAVTALGSTITLKLLSSRPVFAPEFGVYSHSIGEQWLAGGASNAGGMVLQHYFNSDTLTHLSADIDITKPSGLDYYPLLAPGERFPINDPDLPPRLTPRPPSDASFLYGMLEGLANIEQLGYRCLHEQGGPALRSMRTVGGGAVNQCWNQLRQQRLAVKFCSTESEQAAAGTARLASMAASKLQLW